MVISKSVSSLEIMLNWAQLANVIGDVDLRWPGRLGKMFSIANVLDFDVDILEPSCLLNWSFTHNFMVQLLLPFFMSLLAYMGYVAASFALQLNQTSFLKNRDRLRWWIGMLVSVPHDKQDLSAKWDATIAAFLSSVEVCPCSQLVCSLATLSWLLHMCIAVVGDIYHNCQVLF